MEQRRRRAPASGLAPLLKPTSPQLKRPIQDEIGRALRAMYAELLTKPVPDYLSELAMSVRGSTRTPDLVLLDLGLPGVAGVDAISLSRRSCTATIIVVSASEQRQAVDAALRAGAVAVISKSVSLDLLQEVVQQVLAGTWVEPKWVRPAGALSVGEDRPHAMTPRQQEIAALLPDGHSNKEMAARLGLAEITVKMHLSAIFRLLGVVNRTQAAGAIRRLGLDAAEGRADGWLAGSAREPEPLNRGRVRKASRRRPGWGARRAPRSLHDARQEQGEGGALLLDRMDFDGAVQGPGDEVLDDGQAQPGATDRPARGEERFEHAREDVGRHAAPEVSHLHPQARVRRASAGR
jgi:two-component system, NarL family, nitrate/nitrite response regulator NarL